MKPQTLLNVSIVIVLFCQNLVCGQEGRATPLWIGTAGSPLNQMGIEAGIYRTTLFQGTHKISAPKLVHKIEGAGWLANSPNGMMYGTGKQDGKSGVIGFDPNDESKPIQFFPIGDGGACFVTTDNTGAMLVSAQYGGGSIAVFSLDAQGKIVERRQLIEHSGGSKVVGRRQHAPHPHYVAISPNNRFAFVPDLGLDQLVVYRIDVEGKKLEQNGTVDLPPGSGPRHMKFHTSGKFAFVLNELSMSVTTFSYDPESGAMKLLDTTPTLSEPELKSNGFNSASEIRVHQNGKLVVTANRGHDSLSVFHFEEVSGELKRVQLESIRGSWPRNFNFSPDGTLLAVAGRDSNTVALFSIEPKAGRLFYLQHRTVVVPGPICVTFGQSTDLKD